MLSPSLASVVAGVLPGASCHFHQLPSPLNPRYRPASNSGSSHRAQLGDLHAYHLSSPQLVKEGRRQQRQQQQQQQRLRRRGREPHGTVLAQGPSVGIIIISSSSPSLLSCHQCHSSTLWCQLSSRSPVALSPSCPASSHSRFGRHGFACRAGSQENASEGASAAGEAADEAAAATAATAAGGEKDAAAGGEKDAAAGAAEVSASAPGIAVRTLLCGVCVGRGKVLCNICRGSGKAGSPRTDADIVGCESCLGKGTRRCGRCAGFGTVFP